MTLADYLEKADRGEDVEVDDIYNSGDYQAVVRLLEEGTINGGKIEVEYDRADEIIENKIYEKAKAGVENAVSTILESIYDSGWDKGERAVRNINDPDRLSDKARKKEARVRASDAGIGVGLTGMSAGALSGNNQVAGIGLGVSLVSAGLSSRYQGMRDAEMKKAAEGLSNAYGNFEIDLV